MESQVEDKKRECSSYSKNEQERTIRRIYELPCHQMKMTTKQSEADNIYEPFKKSEKVLNNENESFQAKIESLIDLWRQLSLCGISPKIQYVINLMDWAKLHTLNIVLSGEWKKHKENYGDKLFYEVDNCEKELFKLNNSFSLHCKKLLKVIQDPWGNSILNKLLNTPDPVIEREEFDFFMGESGYLVSMRLKKLCESHCEDLALNLVTAYMRCCKFAESQKISMNLTDDQKRFMLDVYIALLFKYKKTSVILSTLKTLSLRDGLELVKRFAKKRVTISKLWRYANRITQLAAVLFCSTAVMQPIDQSNDVFTDLVDVWMNLCERDDSLEPLIASIRKVIQVTVSAPHMYIFCEALNRRFGPRAKIFNIELYVQALTTDLNLLERQKNDNDKEKLQETSTRLANGLLQLADVLNDHINVCRECVLTSFSLQPTKDCLKKVEEIARKCGYEVLDTGQWKCKMHPPITEEDELALQCKDCGDFMAQLQLRQALNTNTAFSEALTADRLGLSPELCDDLVVVVCSPRYQLLSWLQRWKDLHRLCIMYLEDPERTKNVVTELKFLDIDYSIFMNIKREPESEGELIYDNVIEPDYNPDFDEPPKPKKKRGRKKKIKEPYEEENYLPYVAPKSDPQVLKTLRSFRRTFKRKIDSDTSVSSSDKSNNSSSRALNLKCAKYGDLKSNNAGFSYNNNNNNPAYPDYLGNYHAHRTFSELAFRAHEDMLIKQGLYPKDMYYERQVHQHHSNNKFNAQMPCTSKEYGFSYFDNTPIPSTIQPPWCHTAKDPVRENQRSASPAEPHIDEQNFILNEYTNEITITSESPPEETKQNQTDSILKNLILAASNNKNAKNELNKCDDYKLYTSSTYRNHPQYHNANTPPKSKIITNTHSDSFAKDYSMKTLNLNNNNHQSEYSHVLTEENPQINSDTRRRDDRISNSPKESPPKENPEKNLFREKLIETVFAEENGKMTKKPHKEKKSESIGNKENSRFITKKKNNKNLDQKNPEKVTTKPIKKSEIITDILDVPKKSSLNFHEAYQDNIKGVSDKNNKISNGHIKEIVSKTIKDHNFQSNRKSKLNENGCSISDDAYKISSQGQNNNIDNNTKIKLKELRVILHRINIKFPVKKCDLYNNDVKKSPKKVQSSNRDKFKSRKDDKKLFNTIYNNNLNNVQSQNNHVPVDIVKPLHDKNLKVVINNNDIIKPNLLADYLKYEAEKMKKSKLIPRVVLKKLDIEIPSYIKEGCKNDQKNEKKCNTDAKSVLANVPGLNDTELIQPAPVDSIVQVVQIAGGRPNSAVNSTNTQTSTQVSPHIQRIGQPRDKPETTTENTTTVTTSKTSTTNSKPVSTQAPTLINILSQQIIRPGQSNSNRPVSGPLINILSQQVIRPANTTATPTKTTTTVSSSEEQSNNNPRIVSGEPQIINQIVSPVRSSTSPIKLGTPSESPSRIVQFICQSSDVKLIPMTSFTPNRVVKVATTQTITSLSPSSPPYEDNFSKLIQTTPKVKSEQTNENSETLPKFQQAFGKSVYQNNVDSSNTPAHITNNVISNSIEVDKAKVVQQQKNVTTSVSVKPIQGSVIYTRQMPTGGQTINLIPQTRGQVFRIAASNSEQISLVKDTVIHNKMSALLAAALQGRKANEETDTSIDTNTIQTATRVAISRPALVQSTRLVKPVLQIPSNVIRNTPQTNLSSTTLEQLREFDMVYKQVKERSSTNPSSEPASSETSEPSPQPQQQPQQQQQPPPQQQQQQQPPPPPPQQQQQQPPPQQPQQQRISVTYVNQGQKINCAPVVVVSSYNTIPPAASPALSVASQGSSSPCVTPAPTPTPVLPKVAPKSSKGKSVKNTTMHTSKASPIPKPQQKPQEDEHTTQRIFDILAEYAEQLRNSPDLNNKPAPRRRSNPPTNPSQNSKRKKSSSSKKTGQCSSSMSTDVDVEDPRTLGSEDSSCGVMQLSMADEEQPASTASTSESNDSTAPRQQLILTDSSHNQTRNLIIADSVGEALKMPNTAVLVPGNYIMPVSMVKGGQQIAVVSGGSKILATVPARSGPNMLLFQSFLNQTRKSSVPTVKYSTIQPITGISSQSLAGVSAQPPVILPPPPHGISTVTLGQPITVKKLDNSDRVNTELLLTISQSRENDSTPEGTPQPDSSTNVVSAKIETVDIEETATLTNNSSDKGFTYQKPHIATPIATPVIAQTACPKEDIDDEQNQGTQTIMTLSLNAIDRKGESGKVEEQRVQSVLVTAGSSNGPMLSHSPPHYKQSHCSATATDQNKDDFLRNTEKKNESKTYQAPNVYSLQGKVKKVQAGTQRLDKELQQLRKQAALERELRLQKSLSEECEDLGVDEPSTSDLFPEAELLFDANHSPSFDQSSQDLVKRSIHTQDGKDETKLTLFGDDDFLFETGEYRRGAENDLEYDEDRSRLLTNGQSGTSTESESPCEDATLLQTCTSMSDVTLNSPISPDTYHATTPPHLNKYVHKYSNRKKSDKVKQVENWSAEVSSSEDTTGSTELVKCSSRSPDICTNKPSDEELSDESYKVRVAISKTECSELHCTGDADCSLNRRGARRSVKKLCSCCNGNNQEGAISRKRPAPQPQPQTPTPQKKVFPSKKR